MTNDEQLARALSDQCSNCGYGSGEWTRGTSSSGGLDRIGAVFPPRLVAFVLRVIKRKVLGQRAVSVVELEFGGPTAELPELWNQPDYKEYVKLTVFFVALSSSCHCSLSYRRGLFVSQTAENICPYRRVVGF